MINRLLYPEKKQKKKNYVSPPMKIKSHPTVLSYWAATKMKIKILTIEKNINLLTK